MVFYAFIILKDNVKDINFDVLLRKLEMIFYGESIYKIQ